MPADLRTRTGWLRRLLLAAVLVLLGSVPFTRVEGLSLKDTPASRLRDRDANNAAWRTSLADGRERASYCAYCHGADGNSAKPYVPNLAG